MHALHGIFEMEAINLQTLCDLFEFCAPLHAFAHPWKGFQSEGGVGFMSLHLLKAFKHASELCLKSS